MRLLLPLFTLVISLVSFGANAQIWELSSNRNIDMSSRASHPEQTNIIIDSSKVTLTMGGDHNFYYDITNQDVDGSNYGYHLLDKNDEEVTVVFNPVGKYFDYHLKEFYIRYVLDKVKKIEPPISDAEKAKQDSIKMLSDTTEDEEIKEDTVVYEEAEEMPEYPGGKPEMMSFLQKNIRFPHAAKEAKIHGFVTVTAVVEKDGHLSHVTATKDIGGGCGQEAVRVVKTMPKWSVPQNKGEPVRVSVTIPVSFMPPPK